MPGNYTTLVKLLFALLLLCPTIAADGQIWAWAQQFGGIGSASCDRLATDSEGAILMAGSFQGEFFVGNTLFETLNQRDIYLAKLNEEGVTQWAVQTGSSDDDDMTGLALDEEGNIYVAGAYWVEGVFDTITLTAEIPGRAIFIAKYDAQGQIQWAESFSGSGSKQANDIALDAEGNIYLTGFFQNDLIVGDTLLTAKGGRDVFIAKLDTTGNLLWINQAGFLGQTRGVGLAVDNANNAIVTGTYDGRVIFQQDTLTANTLDNDVFIAKYSSEGELLWGRKAGGVLQDNTADVVTELENNIYVTGSFAGRMTLNDELTIESAGFDDNFYLLSYAPDGAVRWAKSVGSRSIEQATALTINASSIIVGGYYLGSFEVDDLQLINTSGAFDGFVAGFSRQGEAQWMEAVPCDDVLLNTALTTAPDGKVIVGGSLLGNASFDSRVLSSGESFDVFLAQLEEEVTPIQETLVNDFFTIFPNPATDRLFIKTSLTAFTIRIFDSLSRQIMIAENMSELSLAYLPKGLYWVQLVAEGEILGVQKVVIND